MLFVADRRMQVHPETSARTSTVDFAPPSASTSGRRAATELRRNALVTWRSLKGVEAYLLMVASLRLSAFRCSALSSRSSSVARAQATSDCSVRSSVTQRIRARFRSGRGRRTVVRASGSASVRSAGGGIGAPLAPARASRGSARWAPFASSMLRCGRGRGQGQVAVMATLQNRVLTAGRSGWTLVFPSQQSWRWGSAMVDPPIDVGAGTWGGRTCPGQWGGLARPGGRSGGGGRDGRGSA